MARNDSKDIDNNAESEIYRKHTQNCEAVGRFQHFPCEFLRTLTLHVMRFPFKQRQGIIK